MHVCSLFTLLVPNHSHHNFPPIFSFKKEKNVVLVDKCCDILRLYISTINRNINKHKHILPFNSFIKCANMASILNEQRLVGFALIILIVIGSSFQNKSLAEALGPMRHLGTFSSLEHQIF